jgi:protein MpaA
MLCSADRGRRARAVILGVPTMRWTPLAAAVLATLACALLPAAPAAAAADATPPVTTCDAPAEWQRASFVVRFAATDAGSGVASIWAAIDEDAPVSVGDAAGGSLEIPVPADHSFDGVHALRFYAVDASGNTETARVAQLRVDTEAPVVTVLAAAGYAGRAVTLSFRVRDRLSPAARELSLVVSDAAGETVATAALGSASMGEWRRARWTPVAAGVFHYAVAAQDLAGNAAASASVTVDVKELATITIGRSVRGRPITVTRFGGAGRRLLVVGGVHGNESGTPVARQLVRYLLAHPRAVPAQSRIDVLVCANPDGFARGSRGNVRGVDLNRNLPTRNWRRRLGPLNDPGAPGLSGGSSPGSEPETKALLAHLRGRFDVVVSLHSRGGIIDCSGPGARALGRRMSALSGLPVGKLWYDPYITGSLGRFVPERYGIPIITVELSSPRLGAGMSAALLAAAR